MYQRFAHIYDSLMYDVDYDRWAGHVTEYIRAHKSDAKTGVDLACGSGNFTVRLARAGFRMTGMDISDEMLNSARQKSVGHNITYVQQGINDLELPTQADFITIMCDGVNYLKEGIDFRRIADNLVTGGVLIFDISTEYKLSKVLGNNFFYDDGEDVTYLWTNSYSPKTKLLNMDLAFFLKTDGNTYERFDEQHVMRAYTAQEILSGMSDYFEIEVLGEQFEPLASPERAKRLHFAATKK